MATKAEATVDYTRRSYGGNPYSISIECIKDNARDIFEAAWNGAKWIRFVKGKLEVSDYYEAPPPIADEPMEDFWPQNAPVQCNMLQGGKQAHSAGIYVKHLHGYSGGYKKKADLLEECGFECMRSRRGESGQYWEHWYLPGTWSARGPIKGLEIDDIRKWIFSNVSPGNVVLEGENWGLSAPE